MVPGIIPSIYNGEKTVIYGLLMEKSEQKGKSMKCKATLTGDIIGKKFKFDVPFELTDIPSEEDVSVIHQLAVKKMIQEWQDDEEPFEQRHKKEIIELSTDASVVSRYTAYIAVDVAQNKPVSGSMQSYELTASGFDMLSLGGGGGGFPPPPGASFTSLPFGAAPSYFASSVPHGAPLLGGVPPPPPPPMGGIPPGPGGIPSAMGGIPPAMGGGAYHSSYSHVPQPVARRGMTQLLSSPVMNESLQMPPRPAMQMLGKGPTPSSVTKSISSPTGVNFIVSLQQANGSWLLNDQLAGEVVSKSVEELKRCCPVSCDDTVMANIWATLVVIELLKKKYPSMLEELELVIMKAEQWLSKQALPSGVNITVLKESASKLF